MDLTLEGEHYINEPTLLECIIVVILKQHLEIENKKRLKGRIGHWQINNHRKAENCLDIKVP